MKGGKKQRNDKAAFALKRKVDRFFFRVDPFVFRAAFANEREICERKIQSVGGLGHEGIDFSPRSARITKGGWRRKARKEKRDRRKNARVTAHDISTREIETRDDLTSKRRSATAAFSACTFYSPDVDGHWNALVEANNLFHRSMQKWREPGLRETSFPWEYFWSTNL